jgi:phosphatidylglycerol:prolipoprotein diacylglycerol transferase
MGIILGVAFYDRIITRGGDIDYRIARFMPEAVVAGGFIGAHLVHVLLYHPELLAGNPWVLLRFWAGISSIGGFFGGAIGTIVVLKIYKQPLTPYGDRILFGVSIGWVFGRLGCATTHDHPGKLTDFFLGVAFNDGVRHDLGLYEFIYTLFLLVPLLFYLTHKQWRTGTLMAAVLLTFSPLRFMLDFLRADDRDFIDARYLGLTPAQYGVLIMLAAGIYLLYLSKQKKWPLQPPLWGKHARKVVRPKSPSSEKTEKDR